MAPIHSFTKQNSTFMVSTIIDLRLVDIQGTSYLHSPYKRPPSINNIFKLVSFLNQARAWFLKIAFVREVSMCVWMCVCGCVCVRPQAMNN